MLKTLFTECPLSGEQINNLKQNGIEIITADPYLGEDELIKKLHGCDIYIIGGADKASKKVIESTNLKMIVFYGTGYENYVDINIANNNNIPVANTPKANAYTVAEHFVALILDAVKQITYLNNETKKGKWIRRQSWNLEGRTIGVIGMGTIGGYVAKIMNKGFGMNVLYFNRGRNSDMEKLLKAKKQPLEKLMTESDVICVTASYSESNVGLINAKNLKLAKKNSVLICTSRAELVDPKALKSTLMKGNLSCAAFDSYYKEPVPSKKNDQWGLLSLPDNKFIITPHTAFGSKEAVDNMNNMVIENLTSFVKTGTPKYKVN